MVHGGRQSMPISYNNQTSPWYSEIERSWSPPRDWTAYGAEALMLYIRGNADNDPDALYVGIEDDSGRVAAVTHPDPDVLAATEWRLWQVPLATFSAAGADVTNVSRIYIGTGTPDAPAAGGSGWIFVDDIQIGLAPEAHE